ncbi:MAG: NfeD family protein [Bacteroidales bacterium]
MMLSILIIVALIITIIILVIIEAVLLPGVSIGAIGAFLLGAYTIYYTYGEFGWSGAIIVSMLILLGIPLLLYWLLFIREKNVASLDTRIDSKVINGNISEINIGDEVVALSRLNPMGKVTKEDDEYEAKSTMGFVDEGEILTVVDIENNCLVVRKK